jgi:hypothetical protein
MIERWFIHARISGQPFIDEYDPGWQKLQTSALEAPVHTEFQKKAGHHYSLAGWCSIQAKKANTILDVV